MDIAGQRSGRPALARKLTFRARESLDIAVFPTAERADEYGRQAGYPYAVGDGWVIITETQALAERIADAMNGLVG